MKLRLKINLLRRLRIQHLINCLILLELTSKSVSACQRNGGSPKIDCHPEPNANEQECFKRGCCWNEQSNFYQAPFVGQPSCYYPANFNCYDVRLIQSSRPSEKNEHQQQNSLEEQDDDEDSRFNVEQFYPYNKKTKRSSDDEEHDADEDDDNGNSPLVLKWSLARRADCPKSGFPDEAEEVELELSVYDESSFNIKISEPKRRRFEPSLPEISAAKNRREVKNARVLSDYQDSSRKKLRLGRVEVRLVQAADSSSSSSSSSSSRASLLRVIHYTSGATLFEADLGKLIYSRQFIQLPTYLPSSLVYGLGLSMGESLLKSSGSQYAKSYTMFNYGHPPQADGKHSYSTYPFYVNLLQLNKRNNTNDRETILDNFEEKRKLMATGALMLNSNAMDVLIQSNVGLANSGGERAAITWRLVGGLVNLFIFTGPKPHDVVSQYQTLIGKPTLPPAWALGYHQSRYNYGQLMPIKAAWARTRSSGIPIEAIWTDIEFLNRSTSYTVNDHELNDLVKAIQQDYGMHYVPIVDPALSLREDLNSYEPLKLAKSMNLFATYPDGFTGESSIATVTTWTESKESGLLDFTNPHIVRYLEIILETYKQKLNFDGLWLDMNEPEVFGNEHDEVGNTCSKDERFPYLPGQRNLNDRTLCMSAEFKAGKHFDIHNLYAFYQTRAHYKALQNLIPNKRPFVISRSQFVGQGKYGGSWLGDLSSIFDHMRWSLIGMIESNWFGQPLIGADICGFFGHTNDELCSRWFSLGAFYPLARNHNDADSKDQDPGSLGEIVQVSARVALMKRYSLLPYLYTLFYENHQIGEPVIRSVLFEYFTKFLLYLDLNQLPQIDDQFMLGPGIMIAPILFPNSETRSVYLAPGRWYDVSIGLPGTDTREGLYEALSSNWPTTTTTENLNEMARSRLDKLHKPIDCHEISGCWLEHQYTPLGAINVYLRGGTVVPTFKTVNHEHSVGMNWRNATFFLEIALDNHREAFGNLIWDDGQSKPESKLYNKANFWVADRSLKITIVEEAMNDEPLQFSGFVVYGVESFQQPTHDILSNGAKLLFNYNSHLEKLSCIFVSPSNDNEANPLVARKYERLKFKW